MVLLGVPLPFHMLYVEARGGKGTFHPSRLIMEGIRAAQNSPWGLPLKWNNEPTLQNQEAETVVHRIHVAF